MQRTYQFSTKYTIWKNAQKIFTVFRDINEFQKTLYK
ncbi:hypothetical protein VCB_001828 [Vibrio cholerae TMA 21]|nr:hypothetical protein VCB_001828 [Vibrio cholerae TMA 21]